MLYLLCIELAMFTAAEGERGRQRCEGRTQISMGSGGGGSSSGGGGRGAKKGVREGGVRERIEMRHWVGDAWCR